MSAVVTTAYRILELRRKTGAGMLQCKTALEATAGDVEQAVARLRAQGAVEAEARMGRRTSEGLILSYIHHNGKLGVLLEVNCETDFVARTDTFATLARQIAEHVAGAAPLAVDRDALPTELVERKRVAFEEAARASGKPEALCKKIVEGKMLAYFRDVALMNQPWVREPRLTVGDLVKQVSAETGENIQVRRFIRFHMGTA